MSAHGPRLRALARDRVEEVLPLHVRVYTSTEVLAATNLLGSWLSSASRAGVQPAVIAGPLSDVALAAIGSTRRADR